eukprot:5308628-Pyramimonas_sp.AAC.1
MYPGRGPIGGGTGGYTRDGDQSEEGQEDKPGREKTRNATPGISRKHDDRRRGCALPGDASRSAWGDPQTDHPSHARVGQISSRQRLSPET